MMPALRSAPVPRLLRPVLLAIIASMLPLALLFGVRGLPSLVSLPRASASAIESDLVLNRVDLLSRGTAHGTVIVVRPVWRSTPSQAGDYQVSIGIVDEANRTVAITARQFSEEYTVLLPAELRAGTYRVMLGIGERDQPVYPDRHPIIGTIELH